MICYGGKPQINILDKEPNDQTISINCLQMMAKELINLWFDYKLRITFFFNNKSIIYIYNL